MNGASIIDSYSGEYFDIEDCNSAVVYAKYIEEDTTELEETLTVLEFKDAAAANEAFNNYLSEEIVDVTVLNSDEYYESDSKSYFVFNMDADAYYQILVNELKEAGLSDEDIETYKDLLLDEMGEYAIIIGIYQKDNLLIQTMYMSTTGANDCNVSSYIEANGFSNPFDVKNSEELIEQFMGAMSGY